MVLARTAETWHQRPSTLLALSDPVVALALDEALAARLAMADRDQRDLTAPAGPTARLHALLRGAGPRTDPEGLTYEDPVALYRAEMARRTEGSVQ